VPERVLVDEHTVFVLCNDNRAGDFRPTFPMRACATVSAVLHYHEGLKEGGHVHQLRSKPERNPLRSTPHRISDMRNAPYITRRLLIVAAFALPACVFIDGCKSTTAPAATAAGESATDDAALAARVKQALVADPALRSLPMSVATYKGVVQLSGYADSDAQIQKALAVTRGVPGVHSVSNDLHLRPQ